MVEIYVGTSGWSYGWNEGGDLEWYVSRTGLNAVELNFSYYRFPFENYVKSWKKHGSGIRWSVKVHRSVTHYHKFDEQAFGIWQRFHDRFKLLDPFIDFYLFQAPPHFDQNDRLRDFLEKTGLGFRAAVELRDSSSLADDEVCRNLQEVATLVSVDSPEFTNRIFHQDRVYCRMHGREDWYRHDYSTGELEETASLLREGSPESVYVFFNNDHHMLKNARVMRELLG